MIKPDMIPKECFVAYQRAFKRGGGVGDAIAAALNAWPGVTTTSWFENSVRKAVLNVPLPQGARDE